jgi:hypothetical protein
MKTVLSIKKPAIYDITYQINSVDDIFSAIEASLKINPLNDKIRVELSSLINIEAICHVYGFEFIYPNYIRFTGYKRWVYFKNDTPVFFDDSCIYTDTEPHTASFKKKEYYTLDFDRCAMVMI